MKYNPTGMQIKYIGQSDYMASRISVYSAHLDKRKIIEYDLTRIEMISQLEDAVGLDCQGYCVTKNGYFVYFPCENFDIIKQFFGIGA